MNEGKSDFPIIYFLSFFGSHHRERERERVRERERERERERVSLSVAMVLKAFQCHNQIVVHDFVFTQEG